MSTLVEAVFAAWCWLPMWSQVLICALSWFAAAECIALVCAAGSYADQIDSDRERVRRALRSPDPARNYGKALNGSGQPFASSPPGERSGEPVVLSTTADRVASGAIVSPVQARRESSGRVERESVAAGGIGSTGRPYKPGIAK